jgi:hypothetical protein
VLTYERPQRTHRQGRRRQQEPRQDPARGTDDKGSASREKTGSGGNKGGRELTKVSITATREKRTTYRDVATGTTAVSGGVESVIREARAKGIVKHCIRVYRKAAKIAVVEKGRRATRRRAPIRGR